MFCCFDVTYDLLYLIQGHKDLQLSFLLRISQFLEFIFKECNLKFKKSPARQPFSSINFILCKEEHEFGYTNNHFCTVYVFLDI